MQLSFPEYVLQELKNMKKEGTGSLFSIFFLFENVQAHLISSFHKPTFENFFSSDSVQTIFFAFYGFNKRNFNLKSTITLKQWKRS